jgi:hypothetical protein
VLSGGDDDYSNLNATIDVVPLTMMVTGPEPFTQV